MIRITGLRLLPQDGEDVLNVKINKRLRLNGSQPPVYTIVKKSLDARKKDNVHYSVTVDVEVKNEGMLLARCAGADISVASKYQYLLPEGEAKSEKRPVVVGFGPGGMFAGLLLAQMGLCPIIVERGEAVDVRAKEIERFWNGEADLNPESNVQFGEGGAGTFSDGKLTTRSKDIRCQKVLEELVAAGAPQEILYDNKPHIGTDLLQGIVKNIREKIIELGGEVRFQSKLTDLLLRDGKINAVLINGNETIETNHVVLSTGHSARDIYELLYDKGVALTPKAFAIGLRIEHPQEMINQAQYGEQAEYLPAADYQLTWGTKEGYSRGVYTFCMCPGGYVVSAPTESGRLAINGMSYHARDGKNANSAIMAQIFTEDFPTDHPLAGIAMQRQLEEAAFVAGGNNYYAPTQRLGDFLGQNPESATHLELEPSCKPGSTEADFAKILPAYITEALRKAIPAMGRRLKGFDHPDAILTGIETRSSSPVRIQRNDGGESVSVAGLFPVGEGAGYAGGIISSAIDGIIAAEKIFEGLKMKD